MPKRAKAQRFAATRQEITTRTARCAGLRNALVRLAQNFSLRYPLVIGQGNFGSIIGLPAAAARYTEVKLTPIAEQLMNELRFETVDTRPTYDAVKDEPIVLPARFPNLLVNGTQGIAVGMATNIPPHNLRRSGQGLRASDPRARGHRRPTDEIREGPRLSAGRPHRHRPSVDPRGVRRRAAARSKSAANGNSRRIASRRPTNTNLLSRPFRTASKPGRC